MTYPIVQSIRLGSRGRASPIVHIVHAHVTKRTPHHHTVRTCSGWRRNGQYWEDARAKRQKVDTQVKRKDKGLAKDVAPCEPSRREKMWQERMERVRKMVERDPYEALFGYSNRLLRAMPTKIDHGRWWRREVSFGVGQAFSATEEVRKVQVRTQETSKSDDVPAKMPEDENALVYDPISGRMVPKPSEVPPKKTPNVEDEVKESVEKAGSDLIREDLPGGGWYMRAQRASDETVDFPVKPYRPKADHVQTIKRDPPSFTMLKEDLPQEIIPEATSVPLDATLAEYEQYKARRLQEAERTSNFLETEGFRDKMPSPTASLSRNRLRSKFDDLHSRDQELADKKIVEKKPWDAQRSLGTTPSPGSTFAAWRAKAKISAYNETAADKEIRDYMLQVAGDNLKNKRAVDEQRSAKTEQRLPEVISKPQVPLVHPAADAQAEKDIREYVTRVASGNLKTRRFADQQKDKKEMQDLLDTSRMRNESAAPRKHTPLVHPPEDPQAEKQIRDYVANVASANRLTNRHAEAQRARQATDNATAEMRRKQFEEFNKESRRLAEQSKAEKETRTELSTIKSRLTDAKARLAAVERPAGALQTSLARQLEQSDVAMSQPLKTSLQRLDKTTEVSVLPPGQQSLVNTPQVPVRTHDPVGYNHNKESRKVVSATAREKPVQPRKIPSLADFLGYQQSQGKTKDAKTSRDDEHEIDPSAQWLLGEIEMQKAAHSKFEVMRKQTDVVLAKTPIPLVEKDKALPELSKHDEDAVALLSLGGFAPSGSTVEKRLPSSLMLDIEIAKQDSGLVAEIRKAYEDEYGIIKSGHTQEAGANKVGASMRSSGSPTHDVLIPPAPVAGFLEGRKDPVSEGELVQSRRQIAESESRKQDLDKSPGLFEAAEARKRSETPLTRTEKEPASTLSTPKPSKIAKYTILAYDAKTKDMTTATFESIPSESEKAIQTTIALRHLTYANRFLPKLIALQHRGFVPVHAERNLLILRQDSTKAALMAEEHGYAANDEAVLSERYVDLDRDAAGAVGGDANAKEPRRLESVYSGASERQRERAWVKWKEAQRQERMRRRRRVGRAVRWTAGGVVLSGAVVYLAGVGAEVRGNRGRGKVVVVRRDE